MTPARYMSRKQDDEARPRDEAEWRIIYDATTGWGFPYRVQYRLPGRDWENWARTETAWGARRALRRARRSAKPIGGIMVIDP